MRKMFPKEVLLLQVLSINEEKEKFQLIGKPSEDEGHEEFDNVFKMKIKFFEEKASFKQKIRLLTSDEIKIRGHP